VRPMRAYSIHTDHLIGGQNHPPAAATEVSLRLRQASHALFGGRRMQHGGGVRVVRVEALSDAEAEREGEVMPETPFSPDIDYPHLARKQAVRIAELEAEIRAYQAIWGSKDITDYERDVLRSLAGENVPGLMWGAAMAAAIEYLTGRGYVKRQIRFDGRIEYVITDIGRSALESTSTKRSPAPP